MQRVWKELLGLNGAVVEEVALKEEALVVKVRPKARERDRCPHCRRRCPRYDRGEGDRRWRALDFGTTLVYLEAAAPRVHVQAPWRRRGRGAVGPARRELHGGVRGPSRVAYRAHLQEGGLAAYADRVADGRLDL